MTNLQFTGENHFQGDTQFFKISALPENLGKPTEKKFIAASEKSGSFHALFGNYDQYEVEGGGFIIDAKEECILNHSLKEELEKVGVSLDNKLVIPKKDHRHTVLPKGVYFVGVQNRFDPLSGLKERVRD